MEGYSRYFSVFLLQTLKANEVVTILDRFLLITFLKNTKIFTDEGVEFTNRLVNKIYKKTSDSLVYYIFQNNKSFTS